MGKKKPPSIQGDSTDDSTGKTSSKGKPLEGYSEEFISHMFKPGKSGNPKGRAKGATVSKRLAEILNSADPDNPEQTVRDRMLKECIKYASRGDARFMIEIFNRTEGKVPDRVLGAVGLGPLEGMDLKKLKKIIAAAEKAGK